MKELCELAPLFSPNLHRNYEAADNLTIVKVGIRFPSFLPYRPFKRKRIVEDSILDYYKRGPRVQARATLDLIFIWDATNITLTVHLPF